MGRNLRAALLVAGMAWGCVIACSSFDGEDPAPVSTDEASTPPEGGALDGTTDGTADSSNDAGRCSSRAPRKALLQSGQRTLYIPPAKEHPFAMTTDATNVYWVAQPVADATGFPYDGQSAGRILRVTKAGTNATALVADQKKATAVALDGDYLYWATFDDAAFVPRGALHRVNRACSAPCSPEKIAAFDHRILVLERAASQVLFGVDGDGVVLRIDTGSPNKVMTITTVGSFPTLTFDGAHVYAGSAQQAEVRRMDSTGGLLPQFAQLPAETSADLGLRWLVADCDGLAGVRTRDGGRDLYRIGPDGVVTKGVAIPNPFDVFQMSADAQYTYFAVANAGGVYAIDKKGDGSRIKIYQGNVFGMTVDDDGVYWGEHNNDFGSIHALDK
jgi:hypothetical protein